MVALNSTRVLGPLQDRQDVLMALHEYLRTSESMYHLARTSIFWPTLKQNLTRIYDSCNTCQLHWRAKLPPPPIPKLDFADSSHMDLINLDFAQYSGKYYIVAAYSCSGLVMAASTKDQSTNSALQFLHHMVT